MSVECDICHEVFSTKYILTKHKKVAKYCLSLQGKTSKIECEFCLHLWRFKTPILGIKK